MKLRILSDLHLEGDQSFKYSHIGEDVVVLAGDISSRIPLYLEWIEDIKVPIICIPGNHEFYGHEFDKHLQELKEVGYLYNEIKVIDDVHFICGTGWSDFTLDGCISSDRAAYLAGQYINDFRLIKKKSRVGLGSTKEYYRLWQPKDCIIEHKRYLNFLEDALEATAGEKRVIVGHFLPLGNCIHEMYAGSQVNAYFASDLSAFASNYDGLWIHGHTHTNLDFMYHNTHIVCNPKGYGKENSEFNPDLIIEV